MSKIIKLENVIKELDRKKRLLDAKWEEEADPSGLEYDLNDLTIHKKIIKKIKNILEGK